MRGTALVDPGGAGLRPGSGQRRGACPSVHEPFDQLDGALVRVRLPGGRMTARQLRHVGAAAARHGTTVALTNRGNLEIRGVEASAHRALVRELVAAGVAVTDPQADVLRNVLASPTAGVDPDEVTDTRPVVDVAVERLMAAARLSLSPKFGVLVDGGGLVHVRGRTHDVCLGARRRMNGSWVWEVCLGAALPSHADAEPAPGQDVGTVIKPERGEDASAGAELEMAPDAGAAAVVAREGAGAGAGPAARGAVAGAAVVVAPGDAAAVIGAALALVAEHPEAGGRMAGLVAELGQTEVVNRLERRGQVRFERGTPEGLDPLPGAALRPIGVLAQRQSARVSIGTLPVLGRIAPSDLIAVADLAARAAVAGETAAVYVTPWRSLLVRDVPVAQASEVQGALADLGLAVDPADPALDVVACAGSAGCPAGSTDTQRDGRTLVAALRAAPPDRPLRVHLSGCPKRCADRSTDNDVTLIGTDTNDHYDVVRATDQPSTTPADDPECLPAPDALTAVLAMAQRRSAR